MQRQLKFPRRRCMQRSKCRPVAAVSVITSPSQCRSALSESFQVFCLQYRLLLLLLRCHGDAAARSGSLAYLYFLHWTLSWASSVAWVSESPIIWQSSEMLSVQPHAVVQCFLGRPLQGGPKRTARGVCGNNFVYSQ